MYSHNTFLSYFNSIVFNRVYRISTPYYSTECIVLHNYCVICIHGRPLYVRLSEHQRFTNNSKSFTSTDLQYTSAVAHHAHTTGHTIDFKSTHILSSLTKSSQLDLTEHAAIKIICPSLNKLHSAPNINNQWTDLLPTIKNSFRPRLAYPP